MAKPVTIVGGGVAGLTLGIGLRQRGVPVTVWEAGRYPRHRVCGEFISGEGQNSLTRLGLAPGLLDAGACSAASAAFFSGSRKIAAHALPSAAWCLSRWILDDWLSREFLRLGGDLRVGSRWDGEFGTGIVRASGRRPQPVADGWRLFGLKIHAQGVALDADLEMHLVPAGYVGLCRLAGGEVNICGLFRSKTTVPGLARNWRDWLGGPTDSVLHSRLADARFFDESFSTVAALSLRPLPAARGSECCIGDSLTMIPPLTGNGMSMAFESAEMAIGPLGEYSSGDLTWDRAREEIATACDHRFAARLRWAGWLQQALFNAPPQAALLRLTARPEWLWRGIFARTR